LVQSLKIVNSIEGKEILVTGGLGFVGSNLSLRLLQMGARVTIIDSMLRGSGANMANVAPNARRFSIKNRDVRDRGACEKVGGKQIVFHLAAQTNRLRALNDPKTDAEINYVGTLNVLESCRKNESFERLVFTSSRAVVGDPAKIPVDETYTPKPKDVYSVNKLAAERACLLYRDLYGMPVVILRPSNVYGPRGQMRNSQYGFINLFVGNVLMGKPIRVFGSGEHTRDPIFVDDLVDALIRLSVGKGVEGEVFFAGSGEEVSILQIARLVQKVCGRGRIEFVRFPEPLARGEITRFRVDYRKLAKCVHWHPKVKLADGIRKTTSYYERRLKQYA